MPVKDLSPPAKRDDQRFDDWLLKLWQKLGIFSGRVTIVGLHSEIGSQLALQNGDSEGAFGFVSTGTNSVWSWNALWGGAAWVHNAPAANANSALLAIDNTGLKFYASDNSTASFNRANGIAIINFDGVAKAPVNTTGQIVSTGTAGVGYATGAGGTNTQGTSKSTTVVLNKTCGHITMHNAALNAGVKVSFVVTNSTVGTTDGAVVWVDSGGTANAYRAAVTAVGAGSFTITVENITAGSLSEAPVIGFAVIKSATS